MGSDLTNGVLITGGIYDPSANSWTATSTTNAPAARFYHTAVWTAGATVPVMIVWGGQDDNYFLNSGGRYDPALNEWSAVSNVNAPVARDAHVAVWSGSDMIVWGGEGEIGALDTGGKYNLAGNSWTATETANAPAGRLYPSGVWTGSKLIVWGGIATGVLDTGGIYNPAANTWTATSTTNAPSARRYHRAVWTAGLATPVMIVRGGYGSACEDTGGIYDPVANTWTATSTTNTPSARYYHSAVWADDRMIVWGGKIAGSTWLNTGGIYWP